MKLTAMVIQLYYTVSGNLYCKAIKNIQDGLEGIMRQNRNNTTLKTIFYACVFQNVCDMQTFYFIKISFVHHLRVEKFWAPSCNSTDVFSKLCKKESVSLTLFLWFKKKKVYLYLSGL